MGSLELRETQLDYAGRIRMQAYSSAEHVYWVTNESCKDLCTQLANETGKGKVNYFGVLGGLDASLSHLAAIDSAEGTTISSVLLCDINPRAIDLGIVKCRLINLAENPIEYLRSVIPARISFTKCQEYSNELDLFDYLGSMTWELDWSNMRASLNAIGYCTEEVEGILDSILETDFGMTFSVNGNEVSLGVDARAQIAKAFCQEEYWLNPDRFAIIKRLLGEERIRVVYSPIQAIAKGKLFQHFKEQGLDYIYFSNVNGFMGNRDYKKMLEALQKIGHFNECDMSMIYVKYYNGEIGSEVGNCPNEMVKLSNIDQCSDIRPEAERFSNLL